jgi:hypothetical protein
MPTTVQRLTASQFRPQDRERLNINRGDRIDLRPTPDGSGVELFVNGRQRHEVTAMEMSVQDMYYRIRYEQARADDARIEAAAAQIRAASDDALLAELASDPISSMTAEQASQALRTLAGDIQSSVSGSLNATIRASNRESPEVRIDPLAGMRFNIPRGQQGAPIRSNRVNFERWHMPYASGSSSSVVVEIEAEIADLRRHGYEPKVIAVDGNVMSHLRASTAFQWQHRVEAVPVSDNIDDMFAESATQVEGTLFGIRLIQDDQTEGYVIAVKR